MNFTEAERDDEYRKYLEDLAMKKEMNMFMNMLKEY